MAETMSGASRNSLPEASRLFGPNPKGAARRVNLAVRKAVRSAAREGARRIVVACSGGPDSLALAAAAIDCCAREGLQCATVTVDHGIRLESHSEAQRVSRLLAHLGAAQAHVVGIEATQGGKGPEGDAREGRYGAIDRVAAAQDPKETVVFLGHTADDQAESVLLGFGRGAGAGSVKGMAAWDRKRGYMRPLLDVRRADTVACCSILGLEPVEDPTNCVDGQWRAKDGSPLRRAAVRHLVMPVYRQAMGKDPVPALAATARRLQDDDDALGKWADDVCAAHASRTEGRIELPVAPISALPRAVRGRVIRKCLAAAGCPGGQLKESHVEGVAALFESWHGQKRVDCPGVAAWRIANAQIVVIGPKVH